MPTPKKITIIGAGFSGLSAACFLAKEGYEVEVMEKNDSPGGRARTFSANGFTFDMGPSWYWMPDVFDRFFACFGKKTSDYYKLQRLDPSYRVYWPDGPVDIPAGVSALKALFDRLEPGSSKQLEKFLEEAAYKYKVGIGKLVYKPGRSIGEFMDKELLGGIFRLEVFGSIQRHVNGLFQNPKIRELLSFPVLFLGALPEETPALYSLMNHADLVGGTWYPEGGIGKVVEGVYSLAKSLGVSFVFGADVWKLIVDNGKIKEVHSSMGTFKPDVVLATADYNHVESVLLTGRYRSYSAQYWESRVMAPSCLLYYVGIKKKLKNIKHHSLFFDKPFAVHGEEIYVSKKWPTEPLFYVSATSVSDPTSAPPGHENLFLLVPVAAGLEGDSETIKEKYFEILMNRLEEHIGESIRPHIVYKRTFSVSDFKTDYNSFKGNAYGLANTLLQTAILKPKCKSKMVDNLYYAGHLTVPGPGVPPALISGEIVAKEIFKSF